MKGNQWSIRLPVGGGRLTSHDLIFDPNPESHHWVWSRNDDFVHQFVHHRFKDLFEKKPYIDYSNFGNLLETKISEDFAWLVVCIFHFQMILSSFRKKSSHIDFLTTFIAVGVNDLKSCVFWLDTTALFPTSLWRVLLSFPTLEVQHQKVAGARFGSLIKWAKVHMNFSHWCWDFGKKFGENWGTHLKNKNTFLLQKRAP